MSEHECDGYFSRDSMNSLLFDWGLAKAGEKVKDIWWKIMVKYTPSCFLSATEITSDKGDDKK